MARGFKLEVCFFFFFSTNLFLFHMLPGGFDRWVAVSLAAAALDTYCLPYCSAGYQFHSRADRHLDQGKAVTSGVGRKGGHRKGAELRHWCKLGEGRWSYEGLSLLLAECIRYHCTGLRPVNANQSSKSTVSSFLKTLWCFFLLPGSLRRKQFHGLDQWLPLPRDVLGMACALIFPWDLGRIFMVLTQINSSIFAEIFTLLTYIYM